jgi:ATP-binding cassette subfamily B protein
MKPRSITYKTLAIFWRYTRRYRLDFWIGAIGAGLAVIAQGMIPPLIVSHIFSQLQTAYVHHATLHIGMFRRGFIEFLIAMFIGVVCWRLQSYFVWQFEIKVRRDLSDDIYDHLQSQSQRFHADRFGGALVSQVNKFVGSYERLMDDLIWNVIPSIVTLIVAIGVLAFVSWQYALILLVIVSFYLFVMSRRIVKQLPYNTEAAAKESNQTAALADAITNMGTIRAFGNEDYESERFRGVSDDLFRSNSVLSIEILKSEALSHVQTNGFQVVALLAGLVAVTSDHTNASLLYLLLSYTQNITNQLWQFSRMVRNINRSLGDSVEMTEILGVTPEITEPIQPAKASMQRGEVQFSNVTFMYPENKETPLFENLSLKIKPGEKVGLVGPSGGGKTTITKLLLRFMDIHGGSISIDGQDVTSVAQSDLRSRIAYVSQEPILFHRTLADNIGYGDLNAGHKAVEAVAKMANAHEFITQLPHGYKTLVGERGVKLSGGQRQRVAIARAMLKNAPILVLDEATSALDSESELLIQDALWKLMEGRTAIVIAHRLSTIQKMDRIIVLDEGKIVEQGSHKDLLHMNGTYAKLWAHQSGGFIEPDEEQQE